MLVALTGTIAIAYLALYLAHGFSHATTVALAGTLASLAIITALALVVAEVAQLSGLANEEAQALRVTASALDLRGLLVAGIVVGGARRAGRRHGHPGVRRRGAAAGEPLLERVKLYREAMRVGKDHVASTVNTLVLAYAGATLPLVLLFSQGAKSSGRIITSEIVAVEVVRMLVGSIGLILAVPITTALAAAVLSADDDVHAGHDHAHLDDETLDRVRGEPLPRPVARRRRATHEPDWDDFGPGPTRSDGRDAQSSVATSAK